MDNLPEQIVKRIEEYAKIYARDHSAAPDKETPDWIITDFTAGATFMHAHLSSQHEQEIHKKDSQITDMKAKVLWCDGEFKNLDNEIRELNSENKGLRDSIFLFKSDISSHEQEIKELKADLSYETAARKSLMGGIYLYKKELEEKDAQIKSLTEQHEKEVEGLKAEIGKLKSRNEWLETFG